MSKRRTATVGALTGVLAMSALALGWWNVRENVVEADRPGKAFRYEVSLTNLTRGQIFSPAVIATHNRSMRLFTPGMPASEELAGVAEDAALEPLVETLENSPRVGAVAVLTGENGPILPGETARLTIEASHSKSLLSVVGMLVTTNDAFYALSGASPPFFGSESFQLNAYDAGSEENNELCSHIPGPPCNNGGVRATEGAEGYVHIHAGIHGIGDLEPSEYDWRNPVARVHVRRLR